MQYLSQLVSSAKLFYNDINSATLCGAIDVVVVQHTNGDWISSPFYVQFGKAGIFRPCENEVEVHINGVRHESITMRLNQFGQAYFHGQEPDLASLNTSKPSSGSLPDEECFESTLTNLEGMQITEADSTDYLQKLLQSLEYSEFEANLNWWNERDSTTTEIIIYKIPDGRSKSTKAPNLEHDVPGREKSDESGIDLTSIEICTSLNSEANIINGEKVWVYWNNRWSSWRTALIRLRILRNLELPIDPELDRKLTDIDSKNPSITLIPEFFPQSTTEESLATHLDAEACPRIDLYENNIETSMRVNMPKFEKLELASGTELPQQKSDSVFDKPIKFSQLLGDDKDNPFKMENSISTSLISNEAASNAEKRTEKDNESVKDKSIKKNWQKFKNTSAFNLTSEELKSLNLVEGINEAEFSVTNKYQGTCSCLCLIYLWKSTDRIVVTDIDGTITKSDILGHLMPMVGFEWIQQSVVELYRTIFDRGYRLMYVSARAIGQANTTRSLLENLVQDNKKLPPGPIILSPNSVRTTIKMEVIKRRPQELKIEGLKIIADLFRCSEGAGPFIAGFGNRTSDVDTYRAIGVPDSHIFIVNSSGVIMTATGNRLDQGYKELTGVVSSVFPSRNGDEKLDRGDESQDLD